MITLAFLLAAPLLAQNTQPSLPGEAQVQACRAGTVEACDILLEKRPSIHPRADGSIFRCYEICGQTQEWFKTFARSMDGVPYDVQDPAATLNALKATLSKHGIPQCGDCHASGNALRLKGVSALAKKTPETEKIFFKLIDGVSPADIDRANWHREFAEVYGVKTRKGKAHLKRSYGFFQKHYSVYDGEEINRNYREVAELLRKKVPPRRVLAKGSLPECSTQPCGRSYSIPANDHPEKAEEALAIIFVHFLETPDLKLAEPKPKTSIEAVEAIVDKPPKKLKFSRGLKTLIAEALAKERLLLDRGLDPRTPLPSPAVDPDLAVLIKLRKKATEALARKYEIKERRSLAHLDP